MATKTRAGGYIVLTCKYHQEGHRWVALCEELGTSTFGRSLPDAQRKLAEAVDLHLSTLEEVGETRRFFEEHHIQFYDRKPTDINICATLKDNAFFRPFIQPVRELAAA